MFELATFQPGAKQLLVSGLLDHIDAAYYTPLCKQIEFSGQSYWLFSDQLATRNQLGVSQLLAKGQLEARACTYLLLYSNVLIFTYQLQLPNKLSRVGVGWVAGLNKIKANSASQWSWSFGLAELGNKIYTKVVESIFDLWMFTTISLKQISKK